MLTMIPTQHGYNLLMEENWLLISCGHTLDGADSTSREAGIGMYILLRHIDMPGSQIRIRAFSNGLIRVDAVDLSHNIAVRGYTDWPCRYINWCTRQVIYDLFVLQKERT